MSLTLAPSTTETIPVTLSGKDGAIRLMAFTAQESKNTYFAVGLPKKDGSFYPASRGVSPIHLPDGLETQASFAGITCVNRTYGRTKVDEKTGKGGNRKVDLSVNVEVDGVPMDAKLTISELPKTDDDGKKLYWIKPVVINVGGGGFTAKSATEVEAGLFS